MNVGVGKGFEFARVEFDGEDRGENCGYLTFAERTFAASAVDLYEYGNVEQSFYLFFGVIEVLSYFSHMEIVDIP